MRVGGVPTRLNIRVIAMSETGTTPKHHASPTSVEGEPAHLSLESSIIGEYQLHEKLGQGGMGAVYAATEIESGKSVAVKILLPRNTRDDHFRKRFLREAQAGSMLRGPHIVPVHGLFEDGERLCLVMERIPGGNLQQWIALHPVREVDWIVSIGRQICRGLAQAHASGVVHRDIKPSNILLDKPEPPPTSATSASRCCLSRRSS